MIITNLNTIMNQRYWGGMPPNIKVDILKRVQDLILFFDIRVTEIDEVVKEFKKAIVEGYYEWFIGCSKCGQDIDKELMEKIKSDFPTRDEIDTIFKKHNKSLNEIDIEAKQMLDGYLLYIEELGY